MAGFEKAKFLFEWRGKTFRHFFGQVYYGKYMATVDLLFKKTTTKF